MDVTSHHLEIAAPSPQHMNGDSGDEVERRSDTFGLPVGKSMYL
jgi:hypothetical protein